MTPEQKESTTVQETSFSLASLMKRYVEKQSQAQSEGMAFELPEGEVGTYDAGPVQVVEPKLAWEDAQIALSRTETQARPCPEWANLVAAQDPALAVAFCAGNFPQIVRNFLPMLQSSSLTPAKLKLSRTVDKTVYLEWAKNMAEKEWPAPLLGVAILRLAQEFEQAEQMLDSLKDQTPAGKEPEWLNERAALDWHQGEHEKAAQRWQSMEPTPTVLFNRGMSSLFLGRAPQAHASLTEAVSQISERSSWHHLAQLYLTLSAMQS